MSNKAKTRLTAAGIALCLLASAALTGCQPALNRIKLDIPSEIGFNNQPNATVTAYEAVSTTYYRDSLSEIEQQVYDLMKLALSNPQKPTSKKFDSEIEISNEQMTYISNCVWIDNPVFAQTQTGSIEYSSDGNLLTMTMTQPVEEYNTHMDRAQQSLDKAKEVVSSVDAGWADYQKVKYLHDYIVKNCFYSVEKKDTNNEAYGVLVLGESMCEGYTDAMMMLCNLAGIDSTAAWYDGFTPEDGEMVNGHVWNVLAIDGQYYHVDATTDDGNFKTNGKEQIRPEDQVSYIRFGITTEAYKAIFPQGVDWNEHNEKALPPCTATDYQYFAYNGLQLDNYNRGQASDLFVKSRNLAQQDGNSLSEIQFTNKAAFNQAVADLDYIAGEFFEKTGIKASNYISNTDDRQLVIGISMPS